MSKPVDWRNRLGRAGKIKHLFDVLTALCYTANERICHAKFFARELWNS